MPSPALLSPAGLQFVTEPRLATLSTIGKDDGIHVVAVGFSLVDGVVRIITSDATQKVRNIERDPRATIGLLEGPKWLSLAGDGSIERDAAAVDHAVALYSERYRQPQPNPKRVVIRIDITKALGSKGFVA